MTDRMKIVGRDGKERYLVTDDVVTDLRPDVCVCEQPTVEQLNGEQLVCLVCGKHKLKP